MLFGDVCHANRDFTVNGLAVDASSPVMTKYIRKTRFQMKRIGDNLNATPQLRAAKTRITPPPCRLPPAARQIQHIDMQIAGNQMRKASQCRTPKCSIISGVALFAPKPQTRALFAGKVGFVTSQATLYDTPTNAYPDRDITNAGECFQPNAALVS